MANVDKITAQGYLEPNGEPELVANLDTIKKQFYGVKNGDLIEPIDEDVAASLVTVLKNYGIIPVIANVLTSGSGSASVVYVDYETEDFTTFTSETSYSDIAAAYEAGNIVKARLDATEVIGGIAIFDLVTISSSSVVFARTSIKSGGGKIETYEITHTSADAISFLNCEAS